MIRPRLVSLLALWLGALLFFVAGAALNPHEQPVNVRWAPSASSADREKAERSLGLTDAERTDDRTWRYRLTDQSEANIARLVAHPLVEDTAHIDRARKAVQLDRPGVPDVILTFASAGGFTALAVLLGVASTAATWLWRPDVRSLLSLLAADGAWRASRIASYSMWIFFFLIVVTYFADIRQGGDSWRTADWLINYRHGPVRRGLAGTIFFLVSDLGISLSATVVTAQTAVLAGIYFVTLHIYNARRRELTWLALLYSPAFLLFEYHDKAGAFRKEILTILSFGLLCLAYAKGRFSRGMAVATVLLFAFSALSHEITVFTAPFFVYVLHRLWRDAVISRSTAIMTAMFLSIVAIAVGIFAVVFRGTAAQAQALCESLVARGFSPSICDGSIAWLNKDNVDAYGFYNISYVTYIEWHLAFLTVSLIPLWFGRWVRGREQVMLAVGGLVCMLPAFVGAVDWGRWLHLYISCLFLVILAESVREPIRTRRVPVVFVALYLVAWSMPACCEYGFRGGFLGPISRYLRHVV